MAVTFEIIVCERDTETTEIQTGRYSARITPYSVANLKLNYCHLVSNQ